MTESRYRRNYVTTRTDVGHKTTPVIGCPVNRRMETATLDLVFTRSLFGYNIYIKIVVLFDILPINISGK